MTSRSIFQSWPTPLGIAASFAILIIISIASLWPSGDVVDPGSANNTTHVVDKIMHLVAYAVTILPLVVVKQNVGLSIALVALVWSGVIELLQPFVGRSASTIDLLFNAFGIVLGLTAVRLLKLAFKNN